jgi:hypothetical protein
VLYIKLLMMLFIWGPMREHLGQNPANILDLQATKVGMFPDGDGGGSGTPSMGGVCVRAYFSTNP